MDPNRLRLDDPRPPLYIVCIPQPRNVNLSQWRQFVPAQDKETYDVLEEMDRMLKQMAYGENIAVNAGLSEMADLTFDTNYITTCISNAEKYATNLERLYQTFQLHPELKIRQSSYFVWTCATRREDETHYFVKTTCILGDLVMVTYRVASLYLLLAMKSYYAALDEKNKALSNADGDGVSEETKERILTHLYSACNNVESAGACYHSAAIILGRWITLKLPRVEDNEQDFNVATAHAFSHLCSVFRDMLTIQMMECQNAKVPSAMNELVAVEHFTAYQRFDWALFQKVSSYKDILVGYIMYHTRAVFLEVERHINECDPAMAIALLQLMRNDYRARFYRSSDPWMVMLDKLMAQLREENVFVLIGSKEPSDMAVRKAMPVPHKRALKVPLEQYGEERCDLLKYRRHGQKPNFVALCIG